MRSSHSDLLPISIRNLLVSFSICKFIGLLAMTFCLAPHCTKNKGPNDDTAVSAGIVTHSL